MGASNSAKVYKEAPTNSHGPETYVQYGETKEPYWSADKTATATVRFAEKGLGSKEGTPPTTIIKIFQAAKAKHGDKPALRFEDPLPEFNKETKKAPDSKPFDQWETLTYSQYYDQCHQAARAFVAMGLERYDAVTIYGFNCPQWFMAENAAMMAGGIAAGIYPSDTPAQVMFKAKHSGASIACCQNSKASIFRDQFMAGQLPKLKAVVVWDQDIKEEKLEFEDKTLVITSWKKMLTKSEATEAKVVDATIESLQPGDTAVLIYTSGTTGDPKAVMVTHDNLVFESTCAAQLMPNGFLKGGCQERIVSYLPLSHVAGCMVDIVMPLVGTATMDGYCTVGFARVYDLSKGTIGGRLTCIKPTVFLGVPRVWEKIAAKMQALGKNISGVAKMVSTFAKGKGLEHARACQMGGTGEIPSFYSFSNDKVFTTVKAKLGLEECKFAFTGAAPITVETLEYFGQLGLQINEVYGMSECTGATTWSSDEAHIWGSCGFAMPGTEVRVFQDGDTKKECKAVADVNASNIPEDQQGEICFRGRHIMAGYMANPDFGEEHMALIAKKNADAIDADGWLHSGDKGIKGVNGMFKITGRYKELIIGSGGENIAPVPIEDNIKKLCPAISNIMMIGDKKKYNTALVTLKAKGATAELAGGNDLDADALNFVEGVTTISGACKSAAYIELIKQAIVDTNNEEKVCPSNASKIQKFTILPRDFSVENGELTPTFKTKRGYVMKMPYYANILDRLYSAENLKATFVDFNVEAAEKAAQ